MKQEPESNKNNYLHLSIGVFILLLLFGICFYHGDTGYFFHIIITIILINIALNYYRSSSKTKRIIAYVLCPILLFHKFLTPKKMRNEIKEIDEKIKIKSIKDI